MSGEYEVTKTKPGERRIEGDYGYSSSGLVAVVKGTCDLCGFEGLILFSDTSADEYGAIGICRTCIDLLFQEVEKQSGGGARVLAVACALYVEDAKRKQATGEYPPGPVRPPTKEELEPFIKQAAKVEGGER